MPHALPYIYAYIYMSVQIVKVGLVNLSGQLQGCISLSNLPYQLAPYTGQVDTV